MVTEVNRLTLSELIARFLRSRRDLSLSTIDYYCTLLANLDWYARTQRWPEAAAIARDHIGDFLDYVASQSYRCLGMPRCSLRKALRRYLEIRPRGGDQLWKTDDDQPMSTYSIKITISRLKRRARVNSGGGAHRLRHYFATRYIEAGDINSLRLLGHATLDMLLRYSRYVDARRALDEHRQFSPLDRLYNGGENHHRDDGWGWRY